MTVTKRGQQTYSAGEWGRNRVRIFSDSKTGLMQIEWREHGRRLSKSLKHRDWDEAKRQADRFAAEYVTPEPEVMLQEAEPEPLMLEGLFDIYGCEVTPTKGERSQKYDRAAMKMFLGFLGRDRNPSTLSKRDWDRFIQERRAGSVGPSGEKVSDRTIERDLRFLQAVLNWATQSRNERGELLLEHNPLKGLKPPVEKNPRRVVLKEAEYRTLLEVSLEVDWRFHVALVLAHETGHRIGAIRQLRWSDIDLDEGAIRWRSEHEKTGIEHTLPVTKEAFDALEFARELNPGIGRALVFPAPKDPSKSVSRHLVRDWWSRAEKLAGLESKRGRGWHSLRRKFASDLMEKPLKVLCQLGGWKTPDTLLECYQRADEGQLREALEHRRGALS